MLPAIRSGLIMLQPRRPAALRRRSGEQATRSGRRARPFRQWEGTLRAGRQSEPWNPLAVVPVSCRPPQAMDDGHGCDQGIGEPHPAVRRIRPAGSAINPVSGSSVSPSSSRCTSLLRRPAGRGARLGSPPSRRSFGRGPHSGAPRGCRYRPGSRPRSQSADKRSIHDYPVTTAGTALAFMHFCYGIELCPDLCLLHDLAAPGLLRLPWRWCSCSLDAGAPSPRSRSTSTTSMLHPERPSNGPMS